MFGIVIFRYERKFEVQGLVKPGFALFEMSGVKLIMEQRTPNIHLPGLGSREFHRNFNRIFHSDRSPSLSHISFSESGRLVCQHTFIKTCS